MPSDHSPKRRPTRGTGMTSARLGQMRASDSLAQWGYFTPRFPSGISISALKRTLAEVQRETAFFWFTLNLRPYSLAQGGPWFAFDVVGPSVGGWDVGKWAPDPVEALGVLQDEFIHVLPDDVLRATAESLPGQWMWIDWPEPPAEPHADIRTDLLAALDDLRSKIEALTPAQGGIGCNGPAGDLPVTSAEHTEVVRTIGELRLNVPAAGEDERTSILDDLQALKSYAAKHSGWLIAALAGGAARQAGADLWNMTRPHVEIWHATEEVVRLLHGLAGSL